MLSLIKIFHHGKKFKWISSKVNATGTNEF